jgi:hypothetical protein
VRSWIQKEDGDNEFHCGQKGRAEERLITALGHTKRFSKSGLQASSIGEKGRESKNTLVGHCRKLAESKRTWNARRCPGLKNHKRGFPSGVVTRSAGAVTGMDRDKSLRHSESETQRDGSVPCRQ